MSRQHMSVVSLSSVGLKATMWHRDELEVFESRWYASIATAVAGHVHGRCDGLGAVLDHAGYGCRQRRCSRQIVSSQQPVIALRRVPRVVARRPRQLSGERSAEVVDGPGDDDVVEEVRIERNENDSVTDA